MRGGNCDDQTVSENANDDYHDVNDDQSCSNCRHHENIELSAVARSALPRPVFEHLLVKFLQAVMRESSVVVVCGCHGAAIIIIVVYNAINGRMNTCN